MGKEEMKRPVIIADYRERDSGVIEKLSSLARVEIRELKVGDYLLSSRCCVERKTCEDFAKSIIDARLFEQLNAMKESYEKVILIIEGQELYAALKPQAIAGAIASAILDFNACVIRTLGPSETAQVLAAIAKREQISEKRLPRARAERKPKSVKELQEFLVAGLPGVDKKRAIALLKKFGCPEFVFTATERELRSVSGIGKELARRIRKVLETPYEKKEEKQAKLV